MSSKKREEILEKMDEVHAMLVLAIDDDDPYADELVPEIKNLQKLVSAFPEANGLAPDVLDLYTDRPRLSPKGAIDVMTIMEFWRTDLEDFSEE